MFNLKILFSYPTGIFKSFKNKCNQKIHFTHLYGVLKVLSVSVNIKADVHIFITHCLNVMKEKFQLLRFQKKQGPLQRKSLPNNWQLLSFN